MTTTVRPDGRRIRPTTLDALARQSGYNLSDLRRFTNDGQAGEQLERVVLPDTPAGLEEMMGDSRKIRAVFSNPETAREFVGRYARSVLNTERDMQAEIIETAKQQVRNFLLENGQIERPDLRAPITPGAGVTSLDKHAVYNRRAMGAAIDTEVGDSADYFRLIWHNSNLTASDQARLQRIRAAFSSTVPSEGGHLIPESLRAELLRVALETAIVRPRARVIPMESLRVPFPAIDTTSNASSVYGGVIGAWTEEGATMTATQAKFARIVLDAKKLTAYTQIPNELISDSAISFQAYLDQIFPEALAFYEDDGFINGNGVGQPLGVLNAEATVSVTRNTTSLITWEDVVGMYARMLPGSLGRGVWLASIDTFPQLATMALQVGLGGQGIWLSNGVNTPPVSILGRPVIFTEKSPALGSAGDLSFVDFGFYLIGDRQVMSAMSSPHYLFGQDSTAYRIISRVDGRPWLPGSITPKNGGSALSPYVQLAA
jgi:HK97 family phage major capsid protein